MFLFIAVCVRDTELSLFPFYYFYSIEIHLRDMTFFISTLQINFP